MKAYRYKYDSTSVFCQIWSVASRGLFAVAPLQARGTTIVNSPPLPRPTQFRAGPGAARGSPGEGKIPTFSHKPADSPFPRQGQGRSCICLGARLKLGAVSSRLLPHGGPQCRSVWAALQTTTSWDTMEMLLSPLSLLPRETALVPRERRG